MLVDNRPLTIPSACSDDKDPCLVAFGGQWHLFGTSGSSIDDRWGILHMVAPTPDGPWSLCDTLFFDLPGEGIAAPGVIVDGDRLHLFLQTEYNKVGGDIHHLSSNDGFHWVHQRCILPSLPETDQAGIYDPHPAQIGGVPYLTYSAFVAPRHKPQPDIYLAKSLSNTWDGPWLRLGRILSHEDVVFHHNDRSHPDYEWGLEGCQLVELPNSRILLNAVCFLPKGEEGQRQRVFFALADNPIGPYRSLGPVLSPPHGGENGHASAWVDGNVLRLAYQARSPATGMRWSYGLADFDLSLIVA